MDGVLLAFMVGSLVAVLAELAMHYIVRGREQHVASKIFESLLRVLSSDTLEGRPTAQPPQPQDDAATRSRRANSVSRKS